MRVSRAGSTPRRLTIFLATHENIGLRSARQSEIFVQMFNLSIRQSNADLWHGSNFVVICYNSNMRTAMQQSILNIWR